MLSAQIIIFPEREKDDEYYFYFDRLVSFILAEIQARLSDAEKKSPAFICLERFALREILKNAVDSGSSSFKFDFTKGDDSIEFAFEDDGTAENLSNEQKSYSWKEALLKQSEKVGMEGQSGGSNLGLAISAHYLEQWGGSLQLFQNPGRKGAQVLVQSSLTQLDEAIVLRPDANYKCTMQRELLSDLDERDKPLFDSILREAPPSEEDWKQRVKDHLRALWGDSLAFCTPPQLDLRLPGILEQGGEGVTPPSSTASLSRAGIFRGPFLDDASHNSSSPRAATCGTPKAISP